MTAMHDINGIADRLHSQGGHHDTLPDPVSLVDGEAAVSHRGGRGCVSFPTPATRGPGSTMRSA